MSVDRDAYEILEVHPRAHQAVIQAAYRVLAALYHPDRDPTTAATRRMAEINAAYDKLRTAERRERYDRGRKLGPPSTAEAIVPAWRAQPRAKPAGGGHSEAGRPLDFGRYQGWTITQIAKQDPGYLLWLSRHSSGARFRTEIEIALRAHAKKAAETERTR